MGLRQLISSAGTNANPNMLSPRTPGSTSVAGCSAGGGRSNAGGRSSAAGSAAAASVAAAAAAVAPRSRSAPRGSWWGDDLNWNEFIERQGLFLLMKDANTAKVAAQMSRVKKPQVSAVYSFAPSLKQTDDTPCLHSDTVAAGQYIGSRRLQCA